MGSECRSDHGLDAGGLEAGAIDEAIVLEDKDVEFVTKLGDTTSKKTFKLEDMVFNDQLEL